MASKFSTIDLLQTCTMMETEPSDRSIDHRQQNVLEMTEILDLESLIHVEQTYGLLILLKR